MREASKLITLAFRKSGFMGENLFDAAFGVAGKRGGFVTPTKTPALCQAFASLERSAKRLSGRERLTLYKYETRRPDEMKSLVKMAVENIERKNHAS